MRACTHVRLAVLTAWSVPPPPCNSPFSHLAASPSRRAGSLGRTNLPPRGRSRRVCGVRARRMHNAASLIQHRGTLCVACAHCSRTLRTARRRPVPRTVRSLQAAHSSSSCRHNELPRAASLTIASERACDLPIVVPAATLTQGGALTAPLLQQQIPGARLGLVGFVAALARRVPQLQRRWRAIAQVAFVWCATLRDTRAHCRQSIHVQCH